MGYTSFNFHSVFLLTGSSPLAWGILSYTAKAESGSTGSSPLAWGIHYPRPGCWNTPSVHPHSRGVYVVGCLNSVTSIRFIPTRVGYTTSLFAFTGCFSVHPHSRGVYSSSLAEKFSVGGSSPLAWGILIHSCACKPLQRFIPTRVGYTLKKSLILLDFYEFNPFYVYNTSLWITYHF